MHPQNDAIAVILAILIALVATTLATLAGVMGDVPTTQRFTPDQTCAEWTDGCVVCSRTPQGLACSTPGIACQRGQESCLRR
ncbi:hypothetical protein [Microvirga aerophila]|uniref:Uncharacterized protein n=1 Tax=Microvirga aerophila TaxID=670291 RepID=A0A512BPL9_9HYPH|nr:hypothetical protein [Microvirga aerophila]GEO13906.1 hypothetical protein MAE02_16020 [Microvirga aerophila]